MAGEDKPKIFENGRDMMLSLGVIVVGMLAVVGGTGLCTINPETSDLSAVREVDGEAFLDLEARAAQGAAIRIPDVPEDWVANSARRASVAQSPSSVVGWVTPQEGYLSSWQTQVSLDDALAGFDEHFREEIETINIDGQDVIVASTEERNVRDVWAFDMEDERVLLSGTASEEEFTELVRAFLAVDPVEIG
ncbi:DUF4245 domain-containing protein [Corynebacterium casei]|uniref:DUF4245 domain-containing protein n=1 Tax=Corynebacterium casei TaxID=160386 RepID=UPI00264A2BC5|nr:DUF4245 domain-containing protein [Corynebacterium casei]MDN5729484.1 DUF4245 domain-containing protein [Corynebacterium casei]MDN5741212.1 DUF4245 domain-containing protein [Corynebacterium casei]MDN5825773.1 DUF4245 domain-containing protein [Corynebacterium casei]MDN6132140.1 DUF4245 domain-containing protein [Corynebacterium casei]MDN6415541.1 DUF4245 domain-containing protein [Corynebacterium casei]